MDSSEYLLIYFSMCFIFNPPAERQGCSLGPDGPSILMVKYWHRCCTKIERLTLCHWSSSRVWEQQGKSSLISFIGAVLLG